MTISRMLKARLIPLAACLALSGCLVTASPPPVRAVAYRPAPAPPARTYRPVYADGLVVHFDSAGDPFFYIGRTPHYIPRDHPRYRRVMRQSYRYRRYD